MKGFAGFSIAALLLFAAPSEPATFCDPNLVREVKDIQASMRYQMRPGRCEGIYAQQVSAVSLELRSFGKGFAPFDPDREALLKLAWSAPPDALRVSLRAFSLKPRTYFRMDTEQPAAEGSYDWPSDVLASLQLRGADLGILAWTSLPGMEKVYLPLRAGTSKATDAGYEVTLAPNKKLEHLLVSLRQIDKPRDLFRDREVGGEFPYYPPNEPTKFSTGKIGAPGFYRLVVKATAAAGDSVTSDIDFYHSGD